jgi:hypothetical protein
MDEGEDAGDDNGRSEVGRGRVLSLHIAGWTWANQRPTEQSLGLKESAANLINPL